MIKIGKITKADLHKMNRTASRDMEIESQSRVNPHRVWISKKAYNRKKDRKVFED